MPEPGYTALLSHLHRPEVNVALPTLQAALSHHLSTTSPSPTPLSAIVVCSPFFLAQPFTHVKLQALCTAFRHAVHLKQQALKKDLEESQSGVFGLSAVFQRSIRTRIGQWVSSVVKGVQGGHAVLRLGCCSGLLLGLEDLQVAERLQVGRGSVESEIVVALAEVMDTYSFEDGSSRWETEFQAPGQADTLSLSLILASSSLPLVNEQKLTVLPLRALVRLLSTTLSSAFQSGIFLSTLSSSINSKEGFKLHIAAASNLAQTLHSMSTSPLTTSIAPLSKLTAKVLGIALNNRPDDGLQALSEILGVLCGMAQTIESDWCRSELAHITDDNDIAPDSRDLTKSIWNTLKTFLFSIIMIAGAGLSGVVYIAPTPSDPSNIDPQTHALKTLQTLSHLSFVITQFGGVTTTSTQGFTELKTTFYLAIDLLAQGSALEVEEFVKDLYQSSQDDIDSLSSPVAQARKAYALATIEQLVPVLSAERIEKSVLPMCFPHLSEPTHRETFESAHSVILSIFASHAQKTVALHESNTRDGNATAPATIVAGPEFVQRMVPFYARCLIENSADGKLSTDQLRLAYSALVRSASATANSFSSPDETYALAWYCIALLLDAIRDVTTSAEAMALADNVQRYPETRERKIVNDEQLHRLHLTLISTVSSLPLPLLMRVLEEIRTIIMACSGSGGLAVESQRVGNSDAVGNTRGDQEPDGKGEELAEALLLEVIANVGDREKEGAMRWWYDNRKKLIASDCEAS